MLYGKWRPRRFSEVVGQDHVVTTLRNAITSGQIAHAYLLTGPRGTGKTTTARLLAKAVNCEDIADGEPCNACSACTAINDGTALDLVEMDAASNRGIDDIRTLRERVVFAPGDLRKKVYLLDEAHMLTEPAFNALLKTLEEPPDHAIFVLATTELQKLPRTIVSRCQRFDFRRVPNSAIVDRLKVIAAEEGFDMPEDALKAMAIQSRGGMRDAITLLEQVVAQAGAAPSLDAVNEALGLVHDSRAESLARAILDHGLADALTICRDVGEDGVDMGRFTKGTIELLRARLGALVEAAHSAGRDADPGEVRALLTAIDALASADFRRDPGSPVPLEVAVATAIIGPAEPVAVPAGAAVETSAGGRRAERRRPNTPRPGESGPTPDTPETPEEQFLKRLINACRATNIKLAAYMNGSCEVVSMEGDELVLGCYFDFHLKSIDEQGRPIIEQEASRLLEREVTLKLVQVERKAASAERPPKGGHLAAAAKAAGARPAQSE